MFRLKAAPRRSEASIVAAVEHCRTITSRSISRSISIMPAARRSKGRADCDLTNSDGEGDARQRNRCCVLEVARAFRPRIIAQRDRIEAARRLPEDVARELARTGFFRIFLPEAYGGLDLTPIAALESWRNWRGRTPRSHGACGTATLIGPPPSSRQRLRELSTPTRMSSLRTARAPRAGPNRRRRYRVSGRWSLVSGCELSAWMILLCVVHEDGSPRPTPSGAPETRFMLLPRRRARSLTRGRSAGCVAPAVTMWPCTTSSCRAAMGHPSLIRSSCVLRSIVFLPFPASSGPRRDGARDGPNRDRTLTEIAVDKQLQRTSQILRENHGAQIRLSQAERSYARRVCSCSIAGTALEFGDRAGRGNDGGASRCAAGCVTCRLQRGPGDRPPLHRGWRERALHELSAGACVSRRARDHPAHRRPFPRVGDNGPGIVRIGTGHTTTLTAASTHVVVCRMPPTDHSPLWAGRPAGPRIGRPVWCGGALCKAAARRDRSATSGRAALSGRRDRACRSGRPVVPPLVCPHPKLPCARRIFLGWRRSSSWRRGRAASPDARLARTAAAPARCCSIWKAWPRWASPGWCSGRMSIADCCSSDGDPRRRSGALRGGRGIELDRGAALIAGACLAWGIDNNLTRKLSFADPVVIAMIKGLAAGAVNTALAALSGAAIPAADMAAAAAAVGFLGVGVSLVLFVLALRHSGRRVPAPICAGAVHRGRSRHRPAARGADVEPGARRSAYGIWIMDAPGRAPSARA